MTEHCEKGGMHSGSIADEILKLPYLSYAVQIDEIIKDEILKEIHAAGVSFRLLCNSRFEPGPREFFYFVEQGKLRVEYISAKGKERPLLLYGPGSMINLPASILGCGVLGNFFVLEESVLWKLPRHVIMGEKAPCSYPHLVQACLHVLSSIMLTYYGALTFLEMDSFKTRFCRFLLLHMRRKGNGRFALGITQDECASTLGVHRSTLARAVQELKKAGVLGDFTRNRVHVLDQEKLLRLAEL